MKSAEERFWEKVKKGDADSCWPWAASKNGDGYGTFGDYSGHTISAHKFSYQLYYRREVPTGLWVLHTCDNPACVNPSHLYAGTQKQNMADRKARGRHGYHVHPESRPYGVRNGSAKLDWEKVENIRREYSLRPTYYYIIAQKYNVSKTTITMILNNKTWVKK